MAIEMTNLHCLMAGLILAASALPTQAWAGSKKKTLKIESVPTGARIVLYRVPRAVVYKDCTTPCELVIKSNKEYMLMGEMSDGSAQRLPAIFVKDKFGTDQSGGIHVSFNTNDASQTVYSQIFSEAAPDRTLKPGANGPKPIHRMPQPAPANAQKSGHCKMKFDVTDRGLVTNIRIKSCTDPVFYRASLESVAGFKYEAQQILDKGQMVNVYTRDVETKVSYRLLNDNGDIIPE